jgi:hypothetical protein
VQAGAVRVHNPTQIELCPSGVTCRENAISFPCGDQLNVQQLADSVGGRIRLRPLPFTFTTNMPSQSPVAL